MSHRRFQIALLTLLAVGCTFSSASYQQLSVQIVAHTCGLDQTSPCVGFVRNAGFPRAFWHTPLPRAGNRSTDVLSMDWSAFGLDLGLWALLLSGLAASWHSRFRRWFIILLLLRSYLRTTVNCQRV